MVQGCVRFVIKAIGKLVKFCKVAINVFCMIYDNVL